MTDILNIDKIERKHNQELGFLNNGESQEKTFLLKYPNASYWLSIKTYSNIYTTNTAKSSGIWLLNHTITV